MKKALLLVLILSFGPRLSAHDRKVGILIDATCGQRLEASSEEAAAHPVSCALKEACAKAGFGVIVDGRFYKFDAAGDKLAAALLKATDKKSGVRVRVDAHFDREIISPAILESVN